MTARFALYSNLFFAADPTELSKPVKSPASSKITGNEEEWKTMMLNAISERDQSEKEKSVCFHLGKYLFEINNTVKVALKGSVKRCS